MRNLVVGAAAVLCVAGCGKVTSEGSDGDTTDVSVSVVSGALNNGGGAAVGWRDPPRRSYLHQLLDAINPIGTAWAATWTCTGGTLTPAFGGPSKDPYTYTPLSCSVAWATGKSGSSDWAGTFTLNYGTSCDDVHPLMEHQVASCSATRTTASGGATRTVTGPLGNSVAVTHDTNGQGTGWDSSITPAPTNGGLDLTCGASGCDSGSTLVINGSHITAISTPAGGTSSPLWDHTVTSNGSGLTITGTDTSRVVSGAVTVQHNLAKYTSTTTFTTVGYGSDLCCFPTTGSVSTEFTSGPYEGKTETLTFSSTCGEATLTNSAGTSSSYTLQNCL